jgi:hypothetical protein
MNSCIFSLLLSLSLFLSLFHSLSQSHSLSLSVCLNLASFVTICPLVHQTEKRREEKTFTFEQIQPCLAAYSHFGKEFISMPGSIAESKYIRPLYRIRAFTPLFSQYIRHFALKLSANAAGHGFPRGDVERDNKGLFSTAEFPLEKEWPILSFHSFFLALSASTQIYLTFRSFQSADNGERNRAAEVVSAFSLSAFASFLWGLSSRRQ